MNNKGQALVEFVLILPIFLIILLYIIEFTKIPLKKYELENNMNIIATLYSDKKIKELNNYISKNNIEITYLYESDMTTITIYKQTTYTMPLLKKILGNKIETKRTVYEQ